MVLREEKEIEERKLNLLVFGLPEAAPEASESERLGNDLIQLKDVFTELEIDAAFYRPPKMVDPAYLQEVTQAFTTLKQKFKTVLRYLRIWL